MAITKIQSESLNLADDYTFTGTVAGAGGNNRPAFASTKSSQTLADVTATIIQLDTEVFDTDNCYDTSTYKFTPNVAGKYFIYFKFYLDSNTWNRILQIESDILLNGSSVIDRQSFLSNQTTLLSGVGISSTLITAMNGTTDYIQARIYSDISAGDVFITQAKFGAYKIIE